VNPCWYRCALVWLISGCAACTSAPIRFYTLSAPEAANASPAARTTIAIDVRSVRIPARLNRSQLMIRSGQTELGLLENERWASPLNDEIRDAVRLELQNRSAQMTESAPLQMFAKLSVAIDVQRLEAELGRYALIEASWSANWTGASQASSNIIVKNCSFRAYEEIRGGYSEIVEGYQRETRALADAIFSALTTSGTDIRAACQ
jgi:uncharacterized protein